MQINYEGRTFISLQNSESGEVGADTIFHYHQKGKIVWAEYEGGETVFGTLIAKVNENCDLDIRYQHVNQKGELMTGKCVSTPEILPDGRVRLHEKWQWTCRDFSTGESIVEEIQ